jgi:Na+/H+ antiporter NhaD/arsenite permease-like protein
VPAAENIGSALPVWSVVPFASLLLCIAIIPLFAGHWWEKNFGKVALVLALPVVIFFTFKDLPELLKTGHDYISFIILLGSLFTVSGGIVIRGSVGGRPVTNTILLLIGAVFANLIGTTGASMLLIRPLIKANKNRKSITHVVIFFIFLVSNVGGSLTPLGDPPLFLGYLKGVPFFWTLQLWPEWLTAVLSILFIFFIMDSTIYRRNRDVQTLDQGKLKILGGINILFLLGIAGSVFLNSPLREIGMFAMGILSYAVTPKNIRNLNEFTFGPIKEVAIIFAGIFATMIPALLLLESKGSALGIRLPWHFFWTTGALSSFLDNAPTYLTFLSTAQGLRLTPDIVGVPTMFLKAISLGAVFMGANSYIGNGPNFMVKAIAEEQGVKMPSFFGYMMYSIAVLIPVFILITFIFFI